MQDLKLQMKVELVLKVIQEIGGEKISPKNDIFFDGGLDSLSFTELIAVLEEDHGLEVQGEVMKRDWTILRTPQGLAESLEDFNGE